MGGGGCMTMATPKRGHVGWGLGWVGLGGGVAGRAFGEHARERYLALAFVIAGLVGVHVGDHVGDPSGDVLSGSLFGWWESIVDVVGPRFGVFVIFTIDRDACT